jgi:hypothetical protein
MENPVSMFGFNRLVIFFIRSYLLSSTIIG